MRVSVILIATLAGCVAASDVKGAITPVPSYHSGDQPPSPGANPPDKGYGANPPPKTSLVDKVKNKLKPGKKTTRKRDVDAPVAAARLAARYLAARDGLVDHLGEAAGRE